MTNLWWRVLSYGGAARENLCESRSKANGDTAIAGHAEQCFETWLEITSYLEVERYDPLWSRVIRGFLLRIYLGGALWSRHETFWKNCIEVTSKKACVQPNTTIYWLYQLTFESSTDMRIELLANSSDSHGPPAIFCGLRICPIEITFLHSERVLL